MLLPNEYQEVTYIQSSWTQYIKIWTQFKTSYKIVIDFQMTVTWWDYVPIWVRTADWWNKRYWIDAWSSYFKVIAGWGDWNNTIAEDTNRHTITLDKSTAIVDWTSYSVQYADYTFNDWIWVFYYHRIWETPDAISSNKLYKLDIYDENWTHINELIPCYRKSDWVIWLYDLVNSVFYTNDWTGTFTKWADVNWYKIKKVRIWVNWVEKQIYPAGWKPWSNTVAYYKFDWNLNDSSWNSRNLSMATWSFTYWTESWWWKYVLTNKSAYSNTISMPLSANWTVSFYACSPQSVTNDYSCTFFDFQWQNWWWIQLRPENPNWIITFWSTSASNPIWNWDYYTVTSSNSATKTVYKNWVNIGTYQGSEATTSNLMFRLNSVMYRWDGRNYEKHSTIIKLWELIVEWTTRTTQEIQDYYNQTKSNYWL